MFWAKVFFDHNLPPPQVLPVVHINMSFFREHFTLNRLLILPRLQANYKFNKNFFNKNLNFRQHATARLINNSRAPHILLKRRRDLASFPGYSAFPAGAEISNEYTNIF